ncbi:Mesoderm development candidate 2 [Corchorus capsularis]|uniref:Mesoderm development candidate 2 n=1 Tax=Corchorus capsularis TaxID=210143 RepID=A0A1R3I875_COCAP|nr:Mesoderm development candidate 2 [Corchorus capsularis]
MKNYPSLLLLLLLLILPLVFSPIGVEGGKRIHITDDLDDVVDDEEDEEWKEWGKSSPEFDPPPSDFDKMEPSQIQEELMKRQMGPAIGFIKLRLGIPRDRDTVAEIAMKWTRVLRTGAIGVRFSGIDISTVMFNLDDGRKMLELKEFLLGQDEAYEIKIGDQVFRRPGDPPLDEVIEKLRQSKEKEGADDDQHVKDEL